MAAKRKRDFTSSDSSAKRQRTGSSSRDIALALSRMRETKFHLPTENNFTVSTAGHLFDLTAMSQGTGRGERVGDKIYVKSLDLHFLVENQDNENLMRVSLVRALKSQMTISDCPTSSAVQPWDRSKVQVYYDAVFNPKDTEAGVGTFLKSKIHRQVIKSIRAQSKYSGTANLHGGLYLFCRTDSGAGPHPAISYGATVWFTDV